MARVVNDSTLNRMIVVLLALVAIAQAVHVANSNAQLAKPAAGAPGKVGAVQCDACEHTIVVVSFFRRISRIIV